MPATDDSPDGVVYDAADQLRHDLNTPLTAMLARAQVLGRTIQRSPSLTEQERAGMLAGVTAMETAVREVVTVIGGIGEVNRGP